MTNVEEDSPNQSANEAPGGGLIFVSDASAEAERLTVALRSRGYPTVDVPLGLLTARVSVQRPALVLCDADAQGVGKVIEAISTSEPGVCVVLLCSPEALADEAREALERQASAVFTRPVEVYALLRRVEALIGSPPEGSLTGSLTQPSRTPVLVAAARKPYMVDASHSEQRSSPSPAPPPISDRPQLPTSIPPTDHWDQDRADPSGQLSLLPAAALREPRGLPESHMSPELASLLQDAEARLDSRALNDVRHQRLSPEAEIDAVLPPEVLASLDEPLDDDDDFDQDVGAGTNSGSDAGGTAPGGTAEQPDPRDRLTNPGGPTAAHPPKLEPSPARASEPPPTSQPGSLTPAPASRGAPAAVTAVEGAADSEPSRKTAEYPHSSGDQQELDPVDEVPVPTTRPPRLRARSLHPGPAIHEPSPRSETASEGTGPAAVRASDTSERGPSWSLAEQTASATLAMVVRQRLTGALVFEDSAGVRRVVFREGDFVTAASSVPDESLVNFLTQRGDLPTEVASQLARKLPPFGRHAGAALIANGHLKQDELWSVLRSHAEWIIGRIVLLDAGQADWETEIPDRLRSEPAVFGGSTGAEVFVETLRRVLSQATALGRLGGERAQLAHGQHFELLSECALAPHEADLVRRAPALSVQEASEAGASADFATVCLALLELGVLEPGEAPSRASSAQAAEAWDDPLDDQALRARLLARYALVQEGDYFALLGIARGATDYEVRKAHETLKRELTPVRVLTARNVDLREQLDTVLEVLDEAYEVLSDRVRRERYRRALEAIPG